MTCCLKPRLWICFFFSLSFLFSLSFIFELMPDSWLTLFVPVTCLECSGLHRSCKHKFVLFKNAVFQYIGLNDLHCQMAGLLNKHSASCSYGYRTLSASQDLSVQSKQLINELVHVLKESTPQDPNYIFTSTIMSKQPKRTEFYNTDHKKCHVNGWINIFSPLCCLRGPFLRRIIPLVFKQACQQHGKKPLAEIHLPTSWLADDDWSRRAVPAETSQAPATVLGAHR